jgi:hypothetical protein
VESDPEAAILLTGTLGSGKTAVGIQLGTLLTEQGIPHAVIDLDWLCWANVPSHPLDHDDLIARNLAAIWPNLRAAGVTHLVLARALIGTSLPEALQRHFPRCRLTIVKLEANRELLEARLRARDRGDELAEHLAELDGMTAAVDAATLEAAAVRNDGASLREVAEQVLTAAGWIVPG